MRAAPCVEVRVLWGGEPLRVRHLSPRRSFWIGEGAAPCDFAVPADALGAERIPIVLAGNDGVSVLVPPGATGTFDGGAGHVPLERACDERAPAPWPGAPACRRLALPRGARAAIGIRPAALSGPGYRAAAADAEAGEATRVVFEVAHGDAERGPGRGILRGAGRLAGAIALAGAAAVGALRAGAGAPEPDPEDVGAEQRYRIFTTLQRIEEREEEQRDPEVYPDPIGQRKDGTWGEPEAQRWGPVARWSRRYVAMDELEVEVIEEYVTALPTLRITLCEAWNDDRGETQRTWFNPIFAPRCDAPLDGPLGLQGLAPPRARAPWAGGEPAPLWRRGYDLAMALPDTSPDVTPAPFARFSRREIQNPTGAPVTPEIADAQLRERLRPLRMCHALALARYPGAFGKVDVRIRVGADGRAPQAETAGADVQDALIFQCVLRALDDLEIPAWRGATATIRVRVELGRIP